MTRVDFTFDYYLPEIDFTEDHFVSRSTKDRKYRENKVTQTYQFGQSDVMLRVYDKIAEIRQKSEKVWFYELWGMKEDVWRIEWDFCCIYSVIDYTYQANDTGAIRGSETKNS